MSVAPDGCLFWVQSLLGSGHLRRALTLAGALAVGDRLAVTLANGGLPSPWPAPPGVDLVQIPSLSSPDAGFASLVTEDGSPASPDLWRARRDRLSDLLRAARPPAVVVTEMFPFGRRAFGDELLPLLEQARSLRPRPLVVASVRDVLVSKREPAKYRWMLDVFDSRYDAVLVHGDPALFPFRLSFPPADEIGPGRVLHTGFVLADSSPASSLAGATSAVVVSAGGGAVGACLLNVALDARPLTRFASDPWLLVAGSNLPPEAFAALAARAAPPVALVRHRPDLPALAAAAEVSVSQAGYNTVAEGLAGGARMVLVPFAAGGEDEQTRRAARLAELGLAAHLPEASLDARALATAIDRAAGTPRPDPSGIAFDGATRAASLVHELRARHADG